MVVHSKWGLSKIVTVMTNVRSVQIKNKVTVGIAVVEAIARMDEAYADLRSAGKSLAA